MTDQRFVHVENKETEEQVEIHDHIPHTTYVTSSQVQKGKDMYNMKGKNKVKESA